MNEANLFTAFVFGALSFVSPCVLPLLPGYLSLMSGYSLQELSDGRTTRARMLRVTLLFVAGFTVVFVSLGAGATAFGQFLRRNQDTFTTVAGWLVVGFGLFVAVTALWNPRIFMPLMRERRLEVRPSRLGAYAPPLMGVAFGFGWTPCIGPILGSILTLAATEETVVRGMVLLLAYSLGLGLPFVLAALGTGKLVGALAVLRRRLRSVNVVSGLLLAGFGVLMLTGGLTDLSIWFQKVLDRIGLERLSNI